MQSTAVMDCMDTTVQPDIGLCTLLGCLLGFCACWLMVAEADELITERRKLLIQLAVVGAGAVLLQGAHYCACSLFTAQDQGFLHSSQSPQSLQHKITCVHSHHEAADIRL